MLPTAGAEFLAALTVRGGELNGRIFKTIRREHQLWILAAPAVCYFILFHYVPMYGVQLAFKDFVASLGITGSPWAGLVHFRKFFNSFLFWRVIGNTLGISLYELAVGFPVPIIFALMLNEMRAATYKRVVQTAVYAPHFISIVVLAGMLYALLSPVSGMVNHLLALLGGEPVNFLAEARWFKTIYVFSGVWQHAGWGAIIYLAVLAGIDPALYEAARIDGATIRQKIVHIDLPMLMPTAVILLILSLGQIMNVGFQKAYLLQNLLNAEASEIIATYIYKVGLIKAQYDYSTAINLFNTVINMVLLISVNQIAKALRQNTLW